MQNGQLLSISRKQARQLCFYLAAIGRPITRDRLVDLFWNEESIEGGRIRLRDTLNKLRSALPDRDIVQASVESVYIDLNRISVDSLEFEKKLAELGGLPWRITNKAALPIALYNDLKHLASLWDQPGYMTGMDYSFSPELDEWLLLKSVSMEQEYLRVLERLTNHEIASGNLEMAASWLFMLLRTDYYNQDFQCRYLNVLVDSGLYTQARQHYEELCQVYSNEGVECTKALLSLGETLHKVDIRPAPKKYSWPIRSSLEIPYTGQEEALHHLQRIYHSGKGVVIFGEAGSGKTRLVQEFYQRLETAPRLLLATCRPIESRIPFEPWISMLRYSVTREEWKKLPGVWADPLSILAPELAERQPGQVSLDSPDSRHRLFESVYQLLRIINRDHSLLVVMDDAHWADESSLEMLAYLIDHKFFDSVKATLVLMARVEGENPHLDKLIRSYTLNQLNRMSVGMLTQNNIASIVETVWGETPPASLVEWLEVDTGGNPFILLETLRALLDAPKRPQLNEIVSLPLASSVHDLVQSRIQSLSPQAREILRIATLLGSRFTPDLIEEVSSFSPEEVATGLDILEAAHLIAVSELDPSTFVFIHEKIRESLLTEIGPARKRLLHLKIAQAILKNLAGKDPNEQAAILAYHFEEAREIDQAFDFWLQAGRYAYRMTSIEQANEAFIRAERLIPRASALSDEQIFQLFYLWNDLAYETHDVATLYRIHEYQMRLGEERQSDLLIGNALDGLSDACLAENKYEQGLEYIDKALPYLVRSGNLHKIMIAYNHRGNFQTMMGHLEPALETFETSYSLAGETGDPYVVRAKAVAEYNLAMTNNIAGWPKQGQRYGEKALADFFRCNYAFGQVLAYGAIALSNFYLARHKAGREAGYLGIALASRISAWRILGYLHCFTSMNELALGNLSAAWEHAQSAKEISEARDYNELISFSYRVMGDIYNRVEAIEKSREMFEKGFASGGEHFIAIDNLLRLGLVMLWTGEKEAEEYIKRAIEQAKKLNMGSIFVFGKIGGLVISSRKGDHDFLELEIDSVMNELRQRSWEGGEVYIGEYKARVRLARNDIEGAVQVLEEMASGAREQAHTWLEVRAISNLLPLLKRQNLPTEDYRLRLSSLLALMDTMAQNIPMRDDWLMFRQKIQKIAQLGL